MTSALLRTILRGGHHETSPPTISASGSGRCRAAGRLADRKGANLSDAAGPHRRRFCRRRRNRHRRAPDRPMAVGAARPAIRHREPARRRQQYRDRGGRQCAGRRLHAPAWSVRRTRINATLYEKLNYNFIRDIAPVAGIIRVPNVMEVQPLGAGQDRSRVHRLRQGQSGQAQHGVGRQRNLGPCGRRAVQDDDRRQHGPRAVSRRGAGADRSARRSGAGDVRPHARRRSSTSGPASCGRWR